MRASVGLTLPQLLLTIALVWGAVVLFGPHVPRAVDYFFGRESEAQRYFNEVLVGIERARDAEGNVPLKQPCSDIVRGRSAAAEVQSCSYDPSASRDFYMVAVVGRSGEVFRYAGRGPD